MAFHLRAMMTHLNWYLEHLSPQLKICRIWTPSYKTFWVRACRLIILLHSCISSDLERVREGLGDKVSFIFQFLAQFIAGFTIGFVYGWKLALVMMSLTPLLAVCGAFLSKVRLDDILSTSQLYRYLEKWSAVQMFARFFQH